MHTNMNTTTGPRVWALHLSLSMSAQYTSTSTHKHIQIKFTESHLMVFRISYAHALVGSIRTKGQINNRKPFADKQQQWRKCEWNPTEGYRCRHFGRSRGTREMWRTGKSERRQLQVVRKWHPCHWWLHHRNGKCSFVWASDLFPSSWLYLHKIARARNWRCC